MKNVLARVLGVSLCGMMVCVHGVECPVGFNERGHENIEWSIQYAFHLTDAQKHLPRVLLIGDSICNAYQRGVIKALEGKVNVSYWVSSYCVTSPDYRPLLELQLKSASYDVIHFNNGLHSLGTAPADWGKGLEATFQLIRAYQPKAKIIWVSSTPLKDAVLTKKVAELNKIGRQIASRHTTYVNDLFALDNPYDRATYWSDVFHHKPSLIAEEVKQVERSILTALNLPIGNLTLKKGVN